MGRKGIDTKEGLNSGSSSTSIDFAEAHNNLGCFFRGAKSTLRWRSFREAVRAWPEYADAHHNLGRAGLGRNWTKPSANSSVR
jgi:hypothetical protein